MHHWLYTGRFTQTVIDQYKPITKKAFRAFVQEQIKEKFNTVLASDSHSDTDEVATVDGSTPVEETTSENKIVTTQEELDGYFTVKSIVRDIIEAKRITLRDAQSYCTVLIDDNNRKILCRLRFNSATKKYIGILDDSKNEEMIAIESIDDIYTHADKLKARAQTFLS